MNTYYTAKDIEELAANGTKELTLGPGVFLTDFARETARYLGVDLVRSETQDQTSVSAPAPISTPVVSNRYNKPSGCQHARGSQSVAGSQVRAPSKDAGKGTNSSIVNRLIEMMGKVIKRDGS